MKKLLAVLAIISIGIGIVCRCLILTISFEYDELFTAISADPNTPFSYIWHHYLIMDVHPPLYNFLLWLYNHWVPYGQEWILRWPSLICSLIALLLSWKLFPRYLGKTARWLFILLLSCNFYVLLYAQHARAYSWLLCLAIPFTFLYLQIARCIFKKRSIPREWWIWYGIFAGLLSWSHYFGALLFGLFSSILFIYAWKQKRPLRWFIWVPTIVLICFLPWVIPNLLQNLSQQRFSGNWWGNQALSWHLLKLWIEFFFSSLKAFYVLIAIGTLGIAYSSFRLRKIKKWPYGREIVLLFIPMALVGIFVLAISFKIFWLLWRYFIPFMPSLYLFVALIISPVCRRYKVLFLVFFCVVGLSFYTFIKARPSFQKGVFFPARNAMEIYKEAFSDKDLYVAALEAFPTQAMTPMYAFYPNRYFYMNRNVYELFSMDTPQREQLLLKQKNALLWMPNCNAGKINRLIQKWDRKVSVFARHRNTCFMIPAGEDRHTIDAEQWAIYTRRFRNYIIQNQQNRPLEIDFFID